MTERPFKRRPFYWDDWNIDHATRHGVSQEESEYAVRNLKPPYPLHLPEGKYLVWGRTSAGRYIQVILVERNADQIDYKRLTLREIEEIDRCPEPLLYIIHARELAGREKSKLRRKR
jgi:hypothetical protein